MFIVSSNYRNRDDKQLQWLVRGKQESPGAAREATSVEMTEVQFVESSDHEKGFGCAIVAEAKTATVNSILNNEMRDREVQLRFYHWWFETVAGKQVHSCTSLRLTPNGSIYAILPPTQERGY